jgi:TIR domain
VWWDRSIPHGSDFNAVIQQQLDAARCILVLWSKAGLESKFVRDEANEGLNGRLLPALIEYVQQPLGFRQLQAADLTDWNGESAHAEWDRLVESIASIVPPPSATAAQASAPIGARQFTVPPRRLGSLRRRMIAE